MLGIFGEIPVWFPSDLCVLSGSLIGRWESIDRWPTKPRAPEFTACSPTEEDFRSPTQSLASSMSKSQWTKPNKPLTVQGFSIYDEPSYSYDKPIWRPPWFRLSSIHAWQRNTVPEVHLFLGSVGFMRISICNYSQLTTPFTNLL